MSDDKYDRMIDRVRRLLAIAEDPAASENEAATAWEQAQKLMTMYSIMEAQVERRVKPSRGSEHSLEGEGVCCSTPPPGRVWAETLGV